ncbi:DUF433 domain-containing protein [Sabulicella rubraurantiaca]|uniref:DUF433 domain-containing protein n=1 Tax=Sabulicella rubraurantiaca TaxID=2811429 RepID=UPI001A9581F6|nr:DUF433 domain-containing protein [Sabulicella rubraurantiaca]
MEDRESPETRRRLSPPGLRTFLAIADLWRLDEVQRLRVLGGPPHATFDDWARAAREHRDLLLDVDTLTRISAVLGIHAALVVLHANEQEGVAWLHGPHGAAPFGGRTPLALATSGSLDDLLTVRRFLDAARGGLYMPPVEAIDWNFTPYRDEDLVIEAQAAVLTDPEILGGREPVLRGTRVPVRDIAAERRRGTPVEEILRDYPSLTAEMVEQAVRYVEAEPLPAPPQARSATVPAGGRLVHREFIPRVRDQDE